MAKYRVYYTTTASSTVVVEAADESEARERAEDEFEFPSLCAQCAGWGRSYSLDLAEWEQVEDGGGVERED